MIVNGIDLQELKYLNLAELLVLIDNDLDTLKILLEEFVEVAPLDIEELVNAVADKNFQAIKEKAHKLKSTFKYFGLNTASNLSQIEELAKKLEDSDQIKQLLDAVLIDFEGALIEGKEIMA